MATYHKRNAVVGAIQYDGENHAEILAEVHGDYYADRLKVETAEGTVIVVKSDFVVKDYYDVVSVVKVDEFNATYVALDDDDSDLQPPESGLPDQGLPEGEPKPDQSLPGVPPKPSQGLPEVPPKPDQGLPGSPAKPDQGLPETPERPDQGLPGQPAKPGQGLPTPPSGARPDQELPGKPEVPSTGVPPPRPDAGLPSGPPEQPDQELPEHASPKRKR